jgi:8-hydroxy-5-deazaflavin:NADPH oxidoreductase
MSTISIIGSGNMAKAIGARAVKGGNKVEVASRDAAKAEALAKTLGGSATAGKFGAAPVGEIVILAVLHASAVPVVTKYGDALAGKIIVDITNPFNADATELETADGTSVAQEIAKVAPTSAPVVKAFNTIFGHVLTQEARSMDALFAGDDAYAKTSVSTFIESLGLRPLDVGGLGMARWLEGAGLLVMGLARNGVANFDFTLGVSLT